MRREIIISKIKQHLGFPTYGVLKIENFLLRKKGLLKKNCKLLKGWENEQILNEKIPETTVSHQESLIKKLYEDCGLKIEAPIRYGQWAGNKNAISGQDSIIAVKT